MHRLTVALLAAFDALIAAALSVAVILAPLTLFWAIGLHASWDLLWPTTTSIWQLGHFVPQIIRLPLELLTELGVSPDAATFTLSLAPAGFAAFAAVFAARSGGRAVRAGAWITGVLTGGAVYAGLGALLWITSRSPIAAVWGWQALLFPALVYALPLLCGALVVAWREGDEGLIDALHDRCDALGAAWRLVPDLVGRGVGMVLLACVGFGAAGVAAIVVLRGGEMVALFQAAQVDVWGAVLLTLVHLALLPNLIVWAFSWIAGPGFAVGTGTAVSPVGSELGVLPAVPLVGLIPGEGSAWFLTLALLPVLAALGAGWALRARMAAVLGEDEPFLPRLVVTIALAAVSAGAAALAAMLSGGSLGPGRLAEIGPDPLALAGAVAAEVLVGSAIILLLPRRAGGGEPADVWGSAEADSEGPRADGRGFSAMQDAAGHAADNGNESGAASRLDAPSGRRGGRSQPDLDAHLAALRADRDAAEPTDTPR